MKKIMGRNKSGPGNGKPSGNKKEESLGVHSTEIENLKEDIDVSYKYKAGEDELSATVALRHPNRNTSKKENQYKGKENKNESDKPKTEVAQRARTVAEELPGKITKEVVAELAAYKSTCCISLYLPTHQAGITGNEGFDPVNFKNALQEIEIILKAKQVLQPTIEIMLEPAYALLKQNDFWLGLSKGLGVFLDDGYFKYIKLPESTSLKIVCEPTFYVTPLVPMLSSNEYFYLLVISKQQVKLFKADAFGIEYVPVVGLPEGGLDEVKRLSDKDATTWRTGSRGGTGGANFHGIGGGNADDKSNIATYFEFVDDILFKQIFNKENSPLLLAGVEYLIPIYKSVCDYYNVWTEALTGSYEHEETNRLHEHAIKLMQPFFNERKMKALNLYGNRSATQLTSCNVPEVVSASYYGRVSHLFVLKGAHVWGTYDEMTTEFKFHSNSNEGGEDLIDNAVEKTLMTGGEVFILDKEEMPADSEVAAVFRY
jgi:hypothetical protein